MKTPLIFLSVCVFMLLFSFLASPVPDNCDCESSEDMTAECQSYCLQESGLNTISPTTAKNLISIFTGIFSWIAESLSGIFDVIKIGFTLIVSFIALLWAFGFVFFVLCEISLIVYAFHTSGTGLAGFASWIWMHFQIIAGLVRFYIWYVQTMFAFVTWLLDTGHSLLSYIPLSKYLFGTG